MDQKSQMKDNDQQKEEMRDKREFWREFTVRRISHEYKEAKNGEDALKIDRD